MGLFDLFRKPDNKKLLEKVEVAPGILLPLALADHWKEIEKTKRTYASVKATPGEPLTLKESKFGDYPCIPSGFSYPTGSDGKPLFPLAQINFSEFPQLEGFPSSGILQFYISDNDLYGVDFDNPQNQADFRVLFFEEHEIEQEEKDFDFLQEIMDERVLIEAPHQLQISIKEEYIGIHDVHTSLSIDAMTNKHPGLTDYVHSTFSSNGHKTGGYAYFTQTDPRADDEQFHDFILLFQMDTDEKIMWGDAGVGNFFIHPDDLAKKDFSKVMYTWDCC